MLRKPRARAIYFISFVSASVSGVGTILPACVSAKVSKSAIGRGNIFFKATSAAGFVGVNAARWAVPSMKRNTVVEKPPSKALARLAIASNTGFTSDRELAMILRMSAVALSRSCAARNSASSRAFSCWKSATTS